MAKVKLKWSGDALFLGKTKMAELRSAQEPDSHRYVLGPNDKCSKRYQTKDDAQQDCEAEVRRLLKWAEVET